MTIEDAKNLITEQDIKEIAEASGVTVRSVRLFLNGKIKRSNCSKYVFGRARKNAEFVF